MLLFLRKKLVEQSPPAFLFPLLLTASLTLGACASSQSRFEALRDSISLQQEIVEADGFRLLLLERPQLLAQGGSVHVYIEGDGRPWLAGGEVVAADPTPRKPLALELMSKDARGGLYLGRPCYYIGTKDAPCSPQYWTNQRYSETVVRAMAAALSDWLVRNPSVIEVSLIGYSGGGVLALLVGERVAQVRQSVAIAAPLDHERWTAMHGYSRLSGSLNVANVHPWRSDLRRLVVFGSDDSNVPLSAMQHALPPGAEIMVLPGVSHECCGERGWSSVLERLAKP